MTDTGALEVGGDKNADGGWELAVGWMGGDGERQESSHIAARIRPV